MTDLTEEVARALQGAFPTIGFKKAPLDAAAQAAIAIVLERAAEVCHEQSRSFLSPEYATGQPLSSFQERFACGQCADAILALKPEAQP